MILCYSLLSLRPLCNALPNVQLAFHHLAHFHVGRGRVNPDAKVDQHVVHGADGPRGFDLLLHVHELVMNRHLTRGDPKHLLHPRIVRTLAHVGEVQEGEILSGQGLLLRITPRLLARRNLGPDSIQQFWPRLGLDISLH